METLFFFRRHFYDPYRLGRVRCKKIIADSLSQACEKAKIAINYFNIEIHKSVKIDGKWVSIENDFDMEHLLADLDCE